MPSYYRQALRNLVALDDEPTGAVDEEPALFDVAAADG